MLYQLPRMNGSGSAQVLFDALIGVQAAFLWVAGHNPRAIAFYAKNGFVADGQHRTMERMGGLGAIRMARPAVVTPR